MYLVNAKWIAPGGKVEKGHLEVREGRLRLHPDSFCVPFDAPHFNVRGHLLLPGLIDPHVHFRQPGAFYKEGIDNGSKAALAGGVTTVLDMPNNQPPITTPGRFSEKQELFRKNCRTHWGLHYQGDVESRPSVPSQAASIKVYMARSSGLPATTTVEGLQSLFARHLRVAIHAEDESRFLAAPPGRASASAVHSVVRPIDSVLSALHKIELALDGLPGSLRPRVILCHVSTAAEVSWLARMKQAGFDIWGETCPHYFLFTSRDVANRGSVLKVNPPIRSEEDKEAVLTGLLDGTLDFLATDHAPHSPQEKDDPKNPPSGIAGIECLAPAAFLLADHWGMPMKRLLEVTSTNAARCYDLPDRGAIREGALADLCILSTTPGSSAPAPIITKARRHPYDRFAFTRTVTATVVAGEVAYNEGAFNDSVRGKEVYS